jgi:hypothetical protein
MTALTYDNAKIGMKVKCIYPVPSYKDYFGKTATIVSFTEYQVSIDWDDNHNLNKSWVYMGATYRDFVMVKKPTFEIVEDDSPLIIYPLKGFTITKRQEIACGPCGRMNDKGVKVCWYCGINF